MSVMSKFAGSSPVRRNAIILASSMIFIYYSSMRIIKNRNKQFARANKSQIDGLQKSSKDKKKGNSDKAAVDARFLRNFLKVIKILIPNWKCKEVAYLVIVAASLIMRTYCDVSVILIGTQIESAIISADGAKFSYNLAKYISAMPILSLTNNLLKYGLDEIKLRFRTKLTKYLYGKYLTNLTYYKMNNLDNRISNADQLLTQDIEKFCNTLADLYSNLSKPFLDIFIYAIKLTSTIGFQGPAVILAYLLVSGFGLTLLRKPVSQMTVEEQRNEGDFRHCNARLITNCEEIAFYQGHKREEINVMNSFNRLTNHVRNFIIFRFAMGFIDNVIAKCIYFK
jgi:ATP-binding cassette, subfamily D (ALD), member 3